MTTRAKPRRAVRRCTAALTLPLAGIAVGLLIAAVGLGSTYRFMPLPERTFGTTVVASQVPGQEATRVAVTTRVPASPSSDFPHPNTLYIPSLGVSASLIPETATGDGDLVIPGNPGAVGIYTGNPGIRSSSGTTLLAGHVTYDSVDGALLPLHSIQDQALVVTTDSSGTPWAWRVVALNVSPRDQLPDFPVTGERRLAIVTCGGRVERTSRGLVYASNVIVTAIPA